MVDVANPERINGDKQLVFVSASGLIEGAASGF